MSATPADWIAHTADALRTVMAPGAAVEVRAIAKRGRKHVRTGYFSDAQKAATAAHALNGTFEGVYFTMNPVSLALLARAAERFDDGIPATADADVTARNWLLVDVDPVRPSGVSATDEEKAAARTVARAIRDWLADREWPAPLVADSGNGWHLLFRIELPNDDDARDLVRAVLEALAVRFDTPAVKVDRSVFNAARIVKLYGTRATKGDSIPERPHRRSKLLVNRDAAAVPRGLLEALAAEVPARTTRPGTHSEGFDLEGFLARHGIRTRRSFQKNGGDWWELEECPFDSAHGEAGEVTVMRLSSGALAFKCHHSSCAGRGWREFRAHFEPDAYSRRSEPRAEAPNASPEWGPPVPLEGRAGDPLPLGRAPTTLRAIVEAVAEASQTPPDMAFGFALGTLATAAMRTALIEGGPGWTQPLNAYCAVVMRPGERKTAVHVGVTEPTHEWERQEQEREREAVAKAKAMRRAKEHRLARLWQQAAKDPSLTAAAVALDAELQLEPEPDTPRLIADDVTPERLASLLAKNAERLAIVSTEGGMFGTNIGRRYASDGSANFEIYLKAYDGEPVRIDRVKRGPDFLERPLLSIVVALQPHTLATIAGDGELSGRGLLSRFIFLVPPSLMGQRRPGAPPPAPEILEAWRAAIFRILDYPPPANTVLRLDPEAQALFLDYQARLEPRLAPTYGDLAHIGGWAAKLHAKLLRIAGLYHVLDVAEGRAAWDDPVSADTLAAALDLSDAFISHALIAADMSGDDERTADARKILRWIRRDALRAFTLRDAQRGLGGHDDADRIGRALELLEITNHVQPAPREKPAGPGRPTSRGYLVNPALSVVCVAPSEGGGGGEHTQEGDYLTLTPRESCDKTDRIPPLPDPTDCPDCGRDSCAGDCGQEEQPR